MLLWSLPPRSSGSSQVCLTVILGFELVVALDFGLQKTGFNLGHSFAIFSPRNLSPSTCRQL